MPGGADPALLRSEIIGYFGIKQARPTAEHKSALLNHLRPFVIERKTDETKDAVKELMNPASTASIQILTSYIALLLLNDLLLDEAVNQFVTKVTEMQQLGSLKPIFAQASPSARAVAGRLLHAAVRGKATKFLSEALRSGADIESPSTGVKSFTLLQRALHCHQVEVAKILLNAGANFNVAIAARASSSSCPYPKDHTAGFTCTCQLVGERSPIALAADSKNCVDLIPELLSNGATIPMCHVLLKAVIHKASVATVHSLIQGGEHPNQCSFQGYFEEVTPLSAAAARCNHDIVALLLEAGADPNGPLKKDFYRLYKHAGSLNNRMKSPLLCTLNTASWITKAEGSPHPVVQLLLKYGADPNLSPLEFFPTIGGSVDPERLADLYELYEDEGEPVLIYPLQAASGGEDLAIVKSLLDSGASLDRPNGTPALTVAVHNRKVETARLLLNLGADPNGFGRHKYCRSALEAAVINEDLEMIDLLLEFGGDLNKCPAVHGGRTPLQRAAEEGKKHIVEHLLRLGASMLSDVAPTGGISVLQGFVENRYHKYISKALKAGASPNQCSDEGRAPLSAAVVNNDLKALRLLLDAGADVQEYSLVANSYEVFQDGDDEEMNSPIQWASRMNYVEAARILCEAGADVNQEPSAGSGNMALHIAVRRGNDVMVKFLVSRGASISAYSRSQTALSVAIGTENISMIKYLLRHGADPNQLDLLGSGDEEPRKPLEMACKDGNLSVVKTLLCAGADPNEGSPLQATFTRRRPRKGGSKVDVVEVLLKYGADVNQRYYDTDTPLQTAILEEEFECAYRLIEKGAHVNAAPSKGERGRTALQAAASVGDVDMVEHLLSKGADVNAPAAVESGATALQAAAIKGYLRIAQILLEHGAEIDAKAGIDNGRTAIDGAAEFGRLDMVKFLLDNYHGLKPVAELVASAYAAAEKGNQWYVMDLLKNYRIPDHEVRF
jgi:ankyrin repeat protein